MKKYLNLATFYLVLGLLSGIFYREFTKSNSFEGQTVLSAVHAHTLILGFVFFLIVLLLEKNFILSKVKHFNKWLVTYNIGLVYVLGTFVARGILQVKGEDMAGLSHIAGLGHAILGVALVWFVVIVRKAITKLEN